MNFNKALKILKTGLRREPWLAIASIAIITLTLLSLNLFVFFTASSQIVLKYLEGKAQINIYFLDTQSSDQILATKTKLEQDARILEVKFVSKDDALKIFTEQNKEEPALLESVQSNPLPASLEVKAKDIKNLSTLSEEFAKFEGVDRVKFFRDVVDSFRKWSTILKISGFVLLFVLGLISVLMILITIGITINSKGIEVEIMKLVGATDKYVKFPLILQGVFYGVAASFIAGILISFVIILLVEFYKPLFRMLKK